MKFRLSARADQDIVSILNYVAADHQPTASDLLKRAYSRLSQLSRFPELGRSRPDIGDGVRGLLISPYVALYRIDPAEIVVLRIIHTSRDLRGTELT